MLRHKREAGWDGAVTKLDWLVSEECLECQRRPAQVHIGANNNDFAGAGAFKKLPKRECLSVRTALHQVGPFESRTADVQTREKTSVLRGRVISKRDQFFQVVDTENLQRVHSADLKAADTEKQPRCNLRPVKFKSILLPFHATGQDENEVSRFDRIASCKKFVELSE
jgi:hypothetical protein